MSNSDSILDTLNAYYEANEEAILKDFFTFLRFMSISSEPSKSDILACVEWLKKQIEDISFQIEVWEVPGHHPVLFASSNKAGPSKPTLLIYNHYDVQPVDPIEEWISPPFDNKGQCFYVLQALKAYYTQFGSLPINVKWCIDGEEEMGSAGLSKLLEQKKEKLKADYLVIVDMGLEHPKQPAVTLGVRGIFTMDVELEGSHTDMHSGCHGGVVYNPIHALVKLLANLRDQDGHVTIPGFYDDVLIMSDKEKKELALDFDEASYLKTFGASPSGGEKGFSPLERAWLRPTLEINGIAGGYYGPGFKTVIPAKAHAKVSCRLVPNQSPEKMANLVSTYLRQQVPEGMKLTIHIHDGTGCAIRADVNSEVVRTFSQAFSDVFSEPCQYIFSGGSIPIVTELAKASQAEVVLVGVGLPDDQIHAPNEHFGVKRLQQGFSTIVRALELLGRTGENNK
jgi:acetylornithine deacetylase/succinyl-diaminopimelate desuccinylase-like protein